jgi:uncharacterized protein YjlB
MKKQTTSSYSIEHFVVPDSGTFPNSRLPVLYYRNILKVPQLLPGKHVKKLFSLNNWSNSWRAGIFEYHHYHSNTHEVLGVIKGETTLQLGGEKGPLLRISKGDVIVIPAGVAHKNLGSENDVTCIGAYPGGADYDMNYGKHGERPKADRNISKVPVPEFDPVLGDAGGLPDFWKQ